ncbi:MAG TPA: universal stress protein [Thermodesulfovibrionales bacterium]|nr:universal stress protein [Thermodesulfovibrionales bacterium]
MQKIIVAYDGSTFAQKAIDKAVELARKEETEIICVNVIEEYCPIGLTEIDCTIVREMQTKESNAITANALAEFKKAGVNARVIIETGSPAEMIIEVAKKEGAAMIIAASHGKHGAKKFAFGSATARLIEHSPVPVLVVK